MSDNPAQRFRSTNARLSALSSKCHLPNTIIADERQTQLHLILTTIPSTIPIRLHALISGLLEATLTEKGAFRCSFTEASVNLDHAYPARSTTIM